MKTRLAHLAGVLAAICFSHQAPAAHGGAPLIADRFPEEPPASLIRRLLPGRGWSTDDPDLVISQTHRWLAGPKLLVIESTLRNKGAAAKTADGVCVADWAFQIWKGPDGTRHQLLTYRKDTWYGSTYWTGPGWTRVGKDWHHPGDKTPSVRRYTAPREGRVTISGRVYKAHLSGDGIRAER